jgi:hypothetical protein
MTSQLQEKAEANKVMASARGQSGSAFAGAPVARYNETRLLRDCAVSGCLGAERLLADRERALRKWNGLLVLPRCMVPQNLPVQALRLGEVAFLRPYRGQVREREQAVRARYHCVSSLRFWNMSQRQANWTMPRRTRALPARASPFSRRLLLLSSGVPVRPP